MIPLLLVRADSLRYAFYAQEVVEVMLCPALRAYHSDQSLLDGLFKLGSDWIPVVSLARLLNRPAQEFGLYDALVLVKTEPRMAVRVSAVEGVRRFGWEQLKPLDSPLDGGQATAARLEVDSEPVLLLVASELLLEKERKLLHRSTQLMAEREQLAEAELERLEGETVG